MIFEILNRHSRAGWSIAGGKTAEKESSAEIHWKNIGHDDDNNYYDGEIKTLECEWV